MDRALLLPRWDPIDAAASGACSRVPPVLLHVLSVDASGGARRSAIGIERAGCGLAWIHFEWLTASDVDTSADQSFEISLRKQRRSPEAALGIPDHRDSVLSPAERAANDQLLICVSRAKTALLELDL